MADTSTTAFSESLSGLSVYDAFVSIRDQLESLRRDKSTYVKSQDVIGLYGRAIEQYERLKKAGPINAPEEQKKVDEVVEDTFQLISLSFLTIGKNHEPPAIFAIISTSKRLLDHLKEAAFFSPKDLESMSTRLDEYRDYCARGKDRHSAAYIALLEEKIEACQIILAELRQALSRLTPELQPKLEQLVSIIRSLSACNTRTKFPEDEVIGLIKQLNEIKATLDTTSMIGKDRPIEEIMAATQLRITPADVGEADAGHKVVIDLLTRCLFYSEIVLQKQGKIDERFSITYQELRGIRNQLEKLMLTQAWSLRETDLHSFLRQLIRIDEARVDGNFLDVDGKPADLYTQRTLLYLLRKSFALIYHLLISSEPVSEALLPIYNQLTTLRKCLIEVKKSGGVSSPRELYPYSMKLNSIDNMRVDGKFMIGPDIPDGQANVTELLSECFELAYELRVEAEENEETARDQQDEGGNIGADQPIIVATNAA